ncbi:spindle and kinetochore-associated protein 2 [Striga asiatica]|uniref:Protein FAM33A n=1 Tax=Striga asiatica TaxID=4170 RepID=A0A5A7Q4B4_STRAF|nr:spindle and kinetochore-associated protein 2 [Striga asiatica]
MEHNEAVDGLLNLFSKANRDLSAVHNKLHKEFNQVYPDHANPMKLVSRLKKIEEEMSSLKDQCRELLAAKQDLIDKARTLLVGNRTQLQRLQSSAGVPVTSDADDPAYVSFNQVIDEWGMQVKSKTENELESDSNDINQLLFSAIVQSN